MNVKFDAVTVKITPPASLDAKKRRLSAAVKAKLTLRALERALEAARAAHGVAYARLTGAELAEYDRLTSPRTSAIFPRTPLAADTYVKEMSVREDA